MKTKQTAITVLGHSPSFDSNRATVSVFLALVTILSLAGSAAQAEETTKPIAPALAAKNDSPVWTVIEEDFWLPLRFAPWESLDAARSNYRHSEEKNAAVEIQKAVGWLNLAAGHALPETQKHLKEAAAELKTVGKDLDEGSVLSANAFDSALAKASKALAEWHYYRAKETWGGSETQDAGKDLVLAAHYLQQAADSAHYQFGEDDQEVITKIWENGKLTTNTKDNVHNWVAKDIEGVEKALSELGKTLEK